MQDYTRGAILILIAAIGFSLQPVFAHHVYSAGANVAGLVWLRFMFPAVLLLLIASKQTWQFRPAVAGLGMINGLASMSFFLALQYTSVSLTVMLYSLFPLLVFLIAWLRKQEVFCRYKTLALVGALLGVYLTMDGQFNGAWAGILAGLGAALCYAVYLVAAPGIMKGGNIIGSVTWNMLGATFIFSVPAISGYSQFPHTFDGWLALLSICLFCTFIPIVLLLKGVLLIQRQFDTSIYSVAEPVAAIFWAWLFLQEIVTVSTLIGASLVISSVLLLIWSQSKATKIIEIEDI